MKILTKSYDGGPDSGVTGYWLIESKRIGSIVLLNFSPGSRDAYHSHAFNAITWWLKGTVIEEDVNSNYYSIKWKPSIVPKYTPWHKFHRVIAGDKGAWAISFRGPWKDSWQEFKNNKYIKLTHGRIIK